MAFEPVDTPILYSLGCPFIEEVEFVDEIPKT